jgi:hypothetical protein
MVEVEYQQAWNCSSRCYREKAKISVNPTSVWARVRFVTTVQAVRLRIVVVVYYASHRAKVVVNPQNASTIPWRIASVTRIRTPAVVLLLVV